MTSNDQLPDGASLAVNHATGRPQAGYAPSDTRDPAPVVADERNERTRAAASNHGKQPTHVSRAPTETGTGPSSGR